MKWHDLLGLSLPPTICLILGEYAVLKLVGRRCASWYTIGCTLGIVSSGIGLILAVHFM